MRVEIDFEGGKNAAGIYVHKRLPEAMGNSVAAFAHAVLSGQTQPGVWYPEEREALSVSACKQALWCTVGVGHCCCQLLNAEVVRAALLHMQNHHSNT